MIFVVWLIVDECTCFVWFCRFFIEMRFSFGLFLQIWCFLWTFSLNWWFYGENRAFLVKNGEKSGIVERFLDFWVQMSPFETPNLADFGGFWGGSHFCRFFRFFGFLGFLWILWISMDFYESMNFYEFYEFLWIFLWMNEFFFLIEWWFSLWNLWR